MRKFFALLLLSALSGCFFQEKWTAFIYPDSGDLSSHKEIGPYSSFSQCQESAIGALRAQGLARSGTYECGLNCEYRNDWQASICEETRR